MKKHYSLIVVLLLLVNVAAGQADTTTADKEADSAKEVVLVANTELLQKADEESRADSMRRAVLEAELAQLKTTDNLKKQELLNELESLKNEERERRERQIARIDSLKQTVTGFPVSPFLDTIMLVYTKLGPFSPRMRAQAIDTRVREMEDDMFYHRDSIRIFTSEQNIDLLYGDKIVLTVTDIDALWMGMSKQELAELYKRNIDKSIKEHRNATSMQTLLKEIGLAIVVIIVATILIKYINKGYRWLRIRLRKARGKWIKGIKIRDYQLLTANNQVRAMFVVLNVVRLFLIFLLIYLSLPVLFLIFPWTKTLSGTLLGYILNPVKAILLGIWNYLPNLITILVILFIFRYINKLLRFLRDEVAKGALKLHGFYADWAVPTYQLIRILLFAFLLIVIFPYLPGSDSPVFKGVSVFLGVLFTFGSSGSLSNIISGLVLTYMRAYKIGDFVKIGEVSGNIIEKTLLVTRIRTIKNEEVTIPNSSVMNGHSVNYSTAAHDIGLIVHTTITIGYDAPWKHVHELLINAALETDYVLQEPKPFVFQTSLNDFTVSYQINAYTRQPTLQPEIYTSLHQHIQDKFNEAGIEIMSPHYTSLRDGNHTTIPADYLPPEYITPSFKVKSDNKE